MVDQFFRRYTVKFIFYQHFSCLDSSNITGHSEVTHFDIVYQPLLLTLTNEIVNGTILLGTGVLVTLSTLNIYFYNLRTL